MHPIAIDQASAAASNEPGDLVSDDRIAQLVAQVYAAGPAAEQSRLLEHLLRPLGVLSLVAVANGIFAQFLFRTNWQDFHVRMEDAQNVRASDVVDLVQHVQQVRVEAVDGLVKILTTSPVMAGSAAAALLITVLVKRSRARRSYDSSSDSVAA